MPTTQSEPGAREQPGGRALTLAVLALRISVATVLGTAIGLGLAFMLRNVVPFILALLVVSWKNFTNTRQWFNQRREALYQGRFPDDDGHQSSSR